MNKPQYRIKLVDPNLQTRGFCQWKLGVTKKKPWRSNPALCTRDVFHCYPKGFAFRSLCCNIDHANIHSPRMFISKVSGSHVLDYNKEGWTRMTLVKEIRLPKITRNSLQRLVDLANLASEGTIEENYINDRLNWGDCLASIFNSICYHCQSEKSEEIFRIWCGMSKKQYGEILKMVS